MICRQLFLETGREGGDEEGKDWDQNRISVLREMAAFEAFDSDVEVFGGRVRGSACYTEQQASESEKAALARTPAYGERTFDIGRIRFQCAAT